MKNEQTKDTVWGTSSGNNLNYEIAKYSETSLDFVSEVHFLRVSLLACHIVQ